MLAEALGDLLGRIWPNLDVSGPLARPFAESAGLAAASGRQAIALRETWDPPYAYTVTIGSGHAAANGPSLRVGASGWMAMAGEGAFVGDERNPVGPAAAAAFAAVEVFKTVFADALHDRVLVRPLPPSFAWSAWDYGQGTPAPPPAALRLDDVHVFGTGAVTHALVWVLARWPAPVTGRVALIDPDRYDESNGQRYIGMRAEDVGASKAEQVAARLRARHPGLSVLAYVQDMNAYLDEHNPACRLALAVAGLDSPEARRQVALKLPQRVVNMWTDAEHVGASRFGGDAWPCLFCAYPEPAPGAYDEVVHVHQQLGLHPGRVRDLLSSAAPLEADDIAVLAQRRGPAEASLYLGRPLRSVLGSLCASGQLTLPAAQAAVSVPFAFASFLAGIGGFVELAREVLAAPCLPGHWQLPVFAAPGPGTWQPRRPREGCYLCADPTMAGILREKYGA